MEKALPAPPNPPPKESKEPPESPPALSKDGDSQKIELPGEAAAKIEAIKKGVATSAKMISDRTYSLKLTLDGNLPVAFKPVRGKRRAALHEVAAFLVGTYLGIETMPVSTVCSHSHRKLVRLLRSKSSEKAALFERKVRPDNKGMVTGACTQWVSGLRDNRLKDVGGWDAVTRWLATSEQQGEVPPLAREASRLMVFDYLISNWDRFSGGNIYLTPDKNGFIPIDHDGTFKPWNRRQVNRMTSLLKRTQRFSSADLEALKSLDLERIERILAWGSHTASAPLLLAEDVKLILERKKAILQHVHELVESHGASQVISL